jgi:hypothetical protein
LEKWSLEINPQWFEISVKENVGIGDLMQSLVRASETGRVNPTVSLN